MKFFIDAFKHWLLQFYARTHSPTHAIRFQIIHVFEQPCNHESTQSKQNQHAIKCEYYKHQQPYSCVCLMVVLH